MKLMATYVMHCSCGDDMTIEARTLPEAISRFKKMMNKAMIADHFATNHPGEEVPSARDVHAQIEQRTEELHYV